jgi:DNA-binding response OmpR family regulator
MESVKILIVEDDTVLQELYQDRFETAGIQVVQAFDGVQAIEKIQAEANIQLVLLDIMLPKKSGYDVLAAMKQIPAVAHIPVVIVSALGDIDDQARGLQLGAKDYITKGDMLPGAVIEKIKQYAISLPRPTQ